MTFSILPKLLHVQLIAFLTTDGRYNICHYFM